MTTTSTNTTMARFVGTTRSRWLRRTVRAAARESLEVRVPWMGRGVCGPQDCRGGALRQLVAELGAFDALRAVVEESGSRRLSEARRNAGRIEFVRLP
jgi:hypothetical protein